MLWHGCPKCGQTPEQNKAFWANKIKKNQQRDNMVNNELQLQGWIVKRYWGCDIQKKLEGVIEDIKHEFQ